MPSLYRRPSEFLDLIEYDDPSEKILVAQYDRGNHEIKQGAKLIVREGQAAIFLHGGAVGDIFDQAGTYTLETGNLPILSKLEAFPYGFHSPIRSDVFFVNMRQFAGNRWGTKNPVILRDRDLGMIRAGGFGTYAFQVSDLPVFMKEVIGARKMVLTYDIIMFLSSLIVEAVINALSAQGGAVLDLAGRYATIAENARAYANERLTSMGIQCTQLMVENISLPEEVEKLIDEQSGVHMAAGNMQDFVQYQSVRAMRDVATEKGGMGASIGALGVGIAAAKQISRQFQENTQTKAQNEGLICPSCGTRNEAKDRFCSNCGTALSQTASCPNCHEAVEAGDKFCPNCGQKLK